THLVALVETIADLECLGLLRERRDESRIVLLVHEEARRRDAHLTGIAGFADDGGRRRLLRIDVVTDDHRSMSAEFHDRGLHVAAGELSELLTNGNRAGERHETHGRLRDEILGDVPRHAEYEIEHARWHTCIMERAHEHHGAGG